HHGFARMPRDVGVNRDRGELLLGFGAEQAEIELGFCSPADAFEEAKNDVSWLHALSSRETAEQRCGAPLRAPAAQPTRRLRAPARYSRGRSPPRRRQLATKSPLRSKRPNRPARRDRRTAAERHRASW